MTVNLSKRETAVTRAQNNEASVSGEKLTGYAVLYSTKSGLIRENGKQFYEIIDPGAFTDSIKSRNVTFVFRHNDDAEYGDTDTKTLRLTEDDTGIKFELDLPAYAKTLRDKLDSGVIGGMSFEFVPTKVRVDESGTHHVEKGELYHVSAVYSPAYPTGQPTLKREANEDWQTDNRKARLKIAESY